LQKLFHIFASQAYFLIPKKAICTMKNHFRIFKTYLALSLLFSIHTVSFAQPPPPPPSGTHGSSDNAPPGAGAPIGEGMFLLIGLAGLYAGKKMYDIRKSLKLKEA